MRLNCLRFLSDSRVVSRIRLNPIASALLVHTFSTHTKNAFYCLTACLQFSKMALFLLAKTQCSFLRDMISTVLSRRLDFKLITRLCLTSIAFTRVFSVEIFSFWKSIPCYCSSDSIINFRMAFFLTLVRSALTKDWKAALTLVICCLR